MIVINEKFCTVINFLFKLFNIVFCSISFPSFYPLDFFSSSNSSPSGPFSQFFHGFFFWKTWESVLFKSSQSFASTDCIMRKQVFEVGTLVCKECLVCLNFGWKLFLGEIFLSKNFLGENFGWKFCVWKFSLVKFILLFWLKILGVKIFVGWKFFGWKVVGSKYFLGEKTLGENFSTFKGKFFGRNFLGENFLGENILGENFFG